MLNNGFAILDSEDSVDKELFSINSQAVLSENNKNQILSLQSNNGNENKDYDNNNIDDFFTSTQYNICY